MATSELLAIAKSVGANVVTQAEYAALVDLIANGMSAGVVPSDVFNKMFRQTTLAAAMLGLFTADASGLNVVDDGDPVAFKAQFLAALRSGNVFQTQAPGDNSTAAATTAFVMAAIAGVGNVSWYAMETAPAGTLKANGAGVLVASYPALATAIYCGDAKNPTALFGYRCTASNGTGRNIAGAYIMLPDMRGEFPRGWDDARGIDTGRVFGTAQADAYKSHAHNVYGAVGDGTGGSGATAGTTGGYVQNFATAVSGGTETRPRNIALLACIKY